MSLISERVQRVAPTVILFAGVIALFYRLFLGEVIFWGVPMLQFYPWQHMAFDQIRSGQLPLWNPLLGNGTPLLANYQTAVFYPPNWLYLLVPTEYAMGIIGVLHVVWAGLGMRLYLKKLGIAHLGQSIGMLSYALGGYLISRFSFLTITAAVSWLPWLIWAVDGVIHTYDQPAKLRRQAVLLAVIVALLLLAGHAQSTFYSLVLAFTYAAFRLLLRLHVPILTRFMSMAAVALAVVAGLLIAAVQLLPTAELLLASQRAGGMQHEAGLTYSFWPWRLLTLFAPNLFGTPADNNFDGYGAYWEDAIYVGLLPLVMAGHGAQRWLRERFSKSVSEQAQLVPFYLGVVPIVFIFALGKASAIFVWLFEHKVPGFSTFQGPTRWMLLAVFSLSVLAALGADTWRSSERGMFWTRLLTAGGFSLVIASLATLQLMGSAVRSNFVPAILLLGVWVILGGVLGLIQPKVVERPRWRPVWELAVLIVVALDLVVANWDLTPTISAAYYHRKSPLAEAIMQSSPGSRTFYLPDQEQVAKFGVEPNGPRGYLSLHGYDSGDIAQWNEFRDTLIPNLGMIDGVASANNFDPLLVAEYSSHLSRFGSTVDDSVLQMLRQMGVGVVLTVDGCGNLTALGAAGKVSACEVADPWPRASLAECSRPDTQGEVTCTTIVTPLSIRSETPMHLTVDVPDDSGSTSLLLLDTYYVGWEARLDGQPVTIHRANSLFRVVELGEGSHQLEFIYDPPSLKIGALTSLLAVIAAAVIWITSRP